MSYVVKLDPISDEAYSAVDKITEILKNAPKIEWPYILHTAKETAEFRLKEKNKKK